MKWQFNKKTKVMSIEGKPNPESFEIAYGFKVPEKNSSAKILDLVVQVSKKRWCSDVILSDLVRKLDAILNLQANVCPWGRDVKN
jgi:hypothetical protein